MRKESKNDGDDLTVLGGGMKNDQNGFKHRKRANERERNTRKNGKKYPLSRGLLSCLVRLHAE